MGVLCGYIPMLLFRVSVLSVGELFPEFPQIYPQLLALLIKDGCVQAPAL
jgi:hypothetical protein